MKSAFAFVYGAGFLQITRTTFLRFHNLAARTEVFLLMVVLS